jgi:phosphoglycerate dehydrogenase-like enzyme
MISAQIGYIGNETGYLVAKEILQSKFSLTRIDPDSDQIGKLISNLDGLLDASMRIRFTGGLIRSANRLKIISTATTGSDHIDLVSAKRCGVTVVTLKEDPDLLQGLTPAAEMTWALLMAVVRNVVGAVQHTRSGMWKREQFPGAMLNGKVLGIVGCGRIGSWVARYGTAFGMEVIGYDPHLVSLESGIKKVEIIQLAQESDIVSIHVHLDAGTKKLINKKFLSSMKQSAFVINTSRGGVVDEGELLRCIEQKRIAGYACDVLSSEPNIDGDPLLKYSQHNDNVIVSPHCGGNSPDAVRIVSAHAAKKIIKFFEQ